MIVNNCFTMRNLFIDIHMTLDHTMLPWTGRLMATIKDSTFVVADVGIVSLAQARASQCEHHEGIASWMGSKSVQALLRAELG